MSTRSQSEDRYKENLPKSRRAMICEEQRRRTGRRLAKQREYGRQVGRKKQNKRGQQASLCTKNPGGGHGVGFASNFAPREPILVPLHPAGVRRLKLTNSSWQDAPRVTRMIHPESGREQCLSSGCAKVSGGESRVTRRCEMGEKSSGS